MAGKVWFIVIFLTGVEVIVSFKITRFHVPRYAFISQPIRLECVFELGQEEGFYLIKWYRGNREFYPYASKSYPAKRIFNIADKGVFVDEKHSGIDYVQLESITEKTSGNYSCEVIVEPDFKSYVAQGELEAVAVLPATENTERSNFSTNNGTTGRKHGYDFVSWILMVITISGFLVP